MVPMIPRMFRLSDGTGAGQPPTSLGAIGLLNGASGYSNTAVGVIYLMKGSIPTSFTGLTTPNARLTDVLCRFQVGQNVPGDFITSQVSVNPAVISTQYVSAVASGVTTWFWWVVGTTDNSNSIGPAGGIYHQAYGSIGTSGSGADLEMPTVNITAGELYRIRNLRLQFPSTWTY